MAQVFQSERTKGVSGFLRVLWCSLFHWNRHSECINAGGPTTAFVERCDNCKLTFGYMGFP